MFLVDYMYAKGSLIFDLVSIWLRSNVDSWGRQITIFIFHPDIFKLVTKELSSSVIHDFYWPYIPDQSHSFTNFAKVIAFFLLYCVTSNHLVTESIIVTEFNIRGSFPFINIVWGPIRSTHSLFRDVYFANLAGSLKFFLLAVLYIGIRHIY